MNSLQSPEWLPSFLIPFFTLSYPSSPPAAPDSFPDASYYRHGYLDACLIVTFIAVMAVLRDVTRIFLLEPFARWNLTRSLRQAKEASATRSNGNGTANGNGHVTHASTTSISKREARQLRRSVIRFAEQGWSAASYLFLWSFGLYVHRNVPTAILHPGGVWVGSPYIPLAAPIKLYYLLETAFYTHQILIINAEARRDDHWRMQTHHFITVGLMIGSYYYNWTRVGCLVMFLMDWCDILLPIAKMLRYLKMPTACDAMFVCFLLSWIVTRHALFILVIVSAWTVRNDIPELNLPSAAENHSLEIWSLSVGLLVVLQVIQLMWFWSICRVAYRVITGHNADDVRSDDEGEPSSEEDKKER